MDAGSDIVAINCVGRWQGHSLASLASNQDIEQWQRQPVLQRCASSVDPFGAYHVPSFVHHVRGLT